MEQVVYWGIMALCAFLILAQLIGQRMKGLTAVLFRLTGGLVGIFCANAVCGLLGLAAVGINVLTLLVVGSLGLPGAALLFILLNLPYG